MSEEKKGKLHADESIFRIPDDLTLVSLEHNIEGPCRFALTLRGTIVKYVELEGKKIWMLDVDFTDVGFDLTPIVQSIIEEE